MAINNQAERKSVITLLEILDDRVPAHTLFLSAIPTLWTLNRLNKRPGTCQKSVVVSTAAS
jgi:hypothetical protein